MMANFSWRQRRNFFVLLQAGTSFSISQVIVEEMFMSFRCHMYEDKEILD